MVVKYLREQGKGQLSRITFHCVLSQGAAFSLLAHRYLCNSVSDQSVQSKNICNQAAIPRKEKHPNLECLASLFFTYLSLDSPDLQDIQNLRFTRQKRKTEF